MSVAVGDSAGYSSQQAYSVAIGPGAGSTSQQYNSVAVGSFAGQSNQYHNSVAIGSYAGNISQGVTSVAVGVAAGSNNQGAYSVAIGNSAGNLRQGSTAVALGVEAGRDNQGLYGTAIGYQAGFSGQLTNGIAIGIYAGYNNQGSNSIAIGCQAGQTNQNNNSIVLNATGSTLNASVPGLIVAPVRSVTSASGNILVYTANKEILQGGIATLGQASVTTNVPTTNAIAINSNSYYFDDGNMHIHTAAGSIWINPLDSSPVRIGAQCNSGAGGGLVVQANITTETTGVDHSFFYKKQSGVNVAFGTETSMDNLNCRINSAGGTAGQLQASAVSGSFSAFVTLVNNVAGVAMNGETNSTAITFTAGTWSSIGSSKNITSGGDMIIAHVHDNTNSRIYRVTAIHGAGSTGGYIAIERMG